MKNWAPHDLLKTGLLAPGVAPGAHAAAARGAIAVNGKESATAPFSSCKIVMAGQRTRCILR